MLLSQNRDGRSNFEMTANQIASRRGSAAHATMFSSQQCTVSVFQPPTESVVDRLAVINAPCVKSNL